MIKYENFYKIDPDDRSLTETNLIYTPKLSSDNKIMCMSFDHEDPYQNREHSLNPNKNFYTEELVKFFFDRELNYFKKFQTKSYCPKIVDINVSEQKIFFEWEGVLCNHIVYSEESLDEYCPDWEQQLYLILKDIVDSGFLKVSLYPHCFFIREKKLYTFDFYGCADIDNPYVKIDNIRGMLGTNSIERFNRAAEGEYLNVSTLFREALSTYVKWPNDALSKIYRKLYE